jgi:hypothetical protein
MLQRQSLILLVNWSGGPIPRIHSPAGERCRCLFLESGFIDEAGLCSPRGGHMRRMAVDWSFDPNLRDFNPSLVRYRRYLNDIGLRDTTIESYLFRVKKFLEFAQAERPPVQTFEKFREHIIKRFCLEAPLITTALSLNAIIGWAGRCKFSFYQNE